MIRANIYSVDRLTPIARESIHDGMAMVASYMGEIVASREVITLLPLTQQGTVDPFTIDIKQIDDKYELNLFGVNLDPGRVNRIGASHYGKGWSFIDIAKNDGEVIKLTTAHEVSHAFGFVPSNSGHDKPNSKYHCCSENCILSDMLNYKPIVTDQNQLPTHLVRHHFNFKRRKGIVELTKNPAYVLAKEYVFCQSCQDDLRQKGSQNIARVFDNRKSLNHSATKAT